MSEEASELDKLYSSCCVCIGQQEHVGRTRIRRASRNTAIDFQGTYHWLQVAGAIGRTKATAWSMTEGGYTGKKQIHICKYVDKYI